MKIIKSAVYPEKKFLEESLIRNIAHDIRSNITGTLSYAYLLERRLGNKDKDTSRFVKNIIIQLQKLTELTNESTDLLKYSSANCKLEKANFSLREVIPLKIEIGNEKYLFNCKIPDIPLYADKIKVSTAFRNLILHNITNTKIIKVSGKKANKKLFITIEKRLKENENSDLSTSNEVKLIIAILIFKLHKGSCEIHNEKNKTKYLIKMPI